ncbi:hypothetical protein VNI00_012571 [Paramarasmius palmivorus]|uniref:Uncharacterized protein n=1 Tax=Paramarasmius palmivorus TaxID=297713 RepID=A0AAW0C466_9AGAR
MGEGSVLRQILPECIGAIQSRMTSDRKQALARYNGYQWKDDSVVELNRQWECIEQMLIRLRESNDLHLDAAELRDRAIRELPDADSSSAQMLTRSLGNMVTDCRLNMWFMAMSKIISDSSSSITRTTSLSSDASELDYRVDTPRPSQILDSLMRLFLFRLKKILTHGFSMAQRYPTMWKAFLQVLDSSAWEPFIEFSCLSDYTSEIVQCHRGSPLYVVEVDAETYHETQEGGEQKEEQIPAEDIPWTARTTSLVVRNASFDFDHALQQAITDSLKHAPNIICLGGIPELGLDETSRQQPYRAVYTNRRAWKGRALARSSFDYTVGFESQNSGDIQTRGNHVRLFGTARCLTLFHCPSSGKLTVSLFVRRRSGRIALNATLRSDSDPASANTIQYVVPTREKKGGLLCAAIHFTDVSQGGGQILIEGDRFWKVHEVKVQWIAGDKVEDVGAGNCNPEWAGLSKEPGETELDPDARSVGHEDFDERYDRQDTC